MRFASYLSVFVSFFVGLSSISTAQDANPKGLPRCDAFRTAVLLELCKNSVTVSVSRSYDRETYSTSTADPFFGTTGLWRRRIHNSKRIGVQWTLNENVRIGISGSLYAGNGTNERSQNGSFSAFAARTVYGTHHAPGVDAKMRLLSGTAWGGEHRIFALGSLQLVSSYRSTIHRTIYSPPFFSFAFSNTGKAPQSAQGSVGLQSSHKWTLDRLGLDIVSQNTFSYSRVERTTRFTYGFDTGLMVAHAASGVALGPKLSIQPTPISGTRLRPYVMTGLAGYFAPAQLLGIAALRGLVLDGSATWLAVQKIDRNYFPPTSDARPVRHRLEAFGRLRYTVEY